MEAVRILLTAQQAEMPSFSLATRVPLRGWGVLCRGVGVGFWFCRAGRPDGIFRGNSGRQNG